MEQEQFEKGIKDEELIAQIVKWEQETEDFYSQLKEVWKQNLLYYKGVQTNVEKIRGKQSRAVENRIWMATETAIPIATSRLPEIVVRAGSEDEQSQMDAQDLQDVLGYHMDRVGIQALSERFLRDMILKRYGVFKVFWDKEEDDLGIRHIDPRRIRIPSYGKSVDELAFVIEDLEMSYGQLVDFFGEETAKKVKPNQIESDNKRRKATYSVQEVWTNEFVAWRCGSEILKKQDNPFYGKGFFEKPRKPYIIKSMFETEESVIGDTDYIQQLIPVQDNINLRKRQIENLGAKVANTPLLIDSDVMSEEQAANITNEEGVIIYGKGAADGTKIRFEAPGQVPNYLFEDLEQSRQEFDNIWGIHSTTRGERQGRETATGRELLKNADLGRIDLLARQLERALDEVAEYWTQLISLFYTEEKTFSIIGQDGIRFIKNFSSKKVGKGMKLNVQTGSTLPKDEVLIHNEAIQLWQLQAIGVRTLYKMIKLPNIAEAIDDYAKTKSGAIVQETVGQPMPQMGVQGVAL